VVGPKRNQHENRHYRPASGGKTSLFKILTKAKIEDRGFSREAHIGVARVPDERLDKLSALYSPKKTTFASVEYVDVAESGRRR